jgi:hypothetical protein
VAGSVAVAVAVAVTVTAAVTAAVSVAVAVTAPAPRVRVALEPRRLGRDGQHSEWGSGASLQASLRAVRAGRAREHARRDRVSGSFVDASFSARAAELRRAVVPHDPRARPELLCASGDREA